MQVFDLFRSKVLLAAVVVALGTSLVQADQNDKNRNNGQNGGQSGRSSGPPPSRSFSSGNSGNSGSSGNAARSFSRPSNSNFSSGSSSSSNNSNAGRNFQSQGNQGRTSSGSSNRSQQSSSQSSSSNVNVNKPQFSNKGNGSSNGPNGKSGPKMDRSVLKASNNENVRLAENDDHKNNNKNSQNQNGQNGQNGGNKGNQNSGNQNGNNQNGGNKGSSNQGGGNQNFGNKGNQNQNGGFKFNQNGGNQNGSNKGNLNIDNKGNQNGNNQVGGNKGNQNSGNNSNSGNQNAGNGNKGNQNSGNNSNNGNQNAGNNSNNGKNSTGNSPFKIGNGNGNGNDPNVNSKFPVNKFPGNNGPKFGKDSDNHDKNFNHDVKDNHDSNHDWKHGGHDSVKDFFDHNKTANNPNPSKVFHDHDFHGNDSQKVAFKKWNDVWKGKNGGGKDNRDWSGKWKNGDRFSAADAIRSDFFSHHDGHHDHDMHHMPFQASWWDSHHDHDHGWHFWGDYAMHHHHNPYWWWGWSSAPALATYCNFGWNSPYYWDYGQGEYIYCNGGNVYVNGRLYEPVPQYYAQTVQMIDQAPLLDADAAAEAEWMPLGVFAVTPDGDNQPAVMVQLAITKNGILGGTATDPEAGASFNVQGTVDQKTQRAVWSYVDGDSNRIVLESSINNLTQNESTGMIHFGPNDQRVVELVRMPEPGEQQSGVLAMPQTLETPGASGPTLPPPEQ